MNQKQICELVLHLTELKILENEKLQITATAELEFVNDDFGENQSIKTEPYQLTVSSPVQQDAVQWYLTQYHIWPSNKYRAKAIDIENRLIEWGCDLYNAVFPKTCNDVLNNWYQSKNEQHVFSVRFDKTSCEPESDRILSSFISLPWHMMHNGYEYLFWNNNKSPINVRCQFPFTRHWEIQAVELPVRVLLINSRPEDDKKFTDTNHRSMAKPLFQSIQTVENKVSIHLLTPPTFLELEIVLHEARQAGEPYHVVCFDGHWACHPDSGLTGFCFEAPEMLPDTQKREVNIIDASQLATCMQSFEIPLVILGTCQHPVNNYSHVITNMLQNGVSSVITFPYQWMPESITQFFKYFYQSLIQGDPISQSMLAGQKAVQSTAIKKEVFHDRRLYVFDWFVPTLIQGNDPQLFHHEDNIQFESNENEKITDLPDPPAKTFVNRSHEFLYIERLLEHDNWAVIQAKGGEGKTALASEMARWFMKTSRVDQIVYVKLEYLSTPTSVLHQIGDQVLTNQLFQKDEWKDYTYAVLKNILETRTFLIIDNMEYTCPNYIDSLITNDLKNIYTIYNLFVKLLEIPETRIIFNTSKTLGEPFDNKTNVFQLKPLNKNSAIELINAFMKDGGYHLRHAPEGRPEGNIERLVQTAHYHPQCLKCLAPTIHRRGINLATRKINTLMNKLLRDFRDPRERALAASFELTIQRFSDTACQYIDYLAVFHESVNQMVFTHMTGDVASIIEDLLDFLQSQEQDEQDEPLKKLNGFDMPWIEDSEQDEDEEELDDSSYGALQYELIQHGLAWKYRDQLLLYPGLTEYIKNRLPIERYPNLRRKWAQGMESYIHFLHRKFSDDPFFCIQTALIDLPNIIAFISYCINLWTPEDIVEIIDILHPILLEIEYEHILKQMDMIRNKLNEFMDKLNND